LIYNTANWQDASGELRKCTNKRLPKKDLNNIANQRVGNSFSWIWTRLFHSAICVSLLGHFTLNKKVRVVTHEFRDDRLFLSTATEGVELEFELRD
jgi:hypothetical protein